MFNSWSTINEEGELEYFNNIQEAKYNPELEKYTDYKFTTEQKINTITSEVIEQTKSDILGVNKVLNDIGKGLSNGALIFKYSSFLLVGFSAYYLYKRANYGK